MRPRGTHRHASAWCLHSAELGSWRLDRPHAVSARKEEPEALRETSLSSSWHGHLDREATTQ
jgi:predicted DNA-binding transcriptional regulator YafY